MKNYSKVLLALIGILFMVPATTVLPMWASTILFVAILAAVVNARVNDVAMNGGVTITLANGQLGGALQTDDGIFGMVMTGIPDSGGYALGTPILVTGMADIATAGITIGSNAFAMKQLQEFYNEAGEGAKLYVMLVADTMSVADMADNTNANGAKLLLDYAAGKIKMLGIISDDTLVTTGTVSSGMNDDVITAAGNMEVMATAYFNAENPFRCIIGGTSYQGVAATLPNQLTGANNRTAILVGDTDLTYSSVGAALGLVLGRLATLPVQAKVSKVKIGAMTNQHAFLGGVAVELTGGDMAVIYGSGYITWKTYPHLAGYYMSGDDTCSKAVDDYHFIARGRVIDKAHVLAYTTFVQEVDDEVLMDSAGNINAGFAKWLEQQIVNQINLTMTNKKEISNVSCFIDPAQNILSTNDLAVVLKVTPVGYASNISIDLGFSNPALG